jgi:hypothetical protein
MQTIKNNMRFNQQKFSCFLKNNVTLSEPSTALPFIQRTNPPYKLRQADPEPTLQRYESREYCQHFYKNTKTKKNLAKIDNSPSNCSLTLNAFAKEYAILRLQNRQWLKQPLCEQITHTSPQSNAQT